MKTRVDKYINDNDNFAPKRTKKNMQLYEDMKDAELENLSIGSNAKVIGENPNQIDIGKIKELLEKNYQDTPKRRSLDIKVEKEEEIELEKTREYDINAILEKARQEKEVDYQEERLKKVRDTQYDILKNLEIDDTKKNKAANEKTKEELLDLINTINLNEKQKQAILENTDELQKTLAPLDLFSDLKGDDDTVVAGAREMTEEIQKKVTEDQEKEPKEPEKDMDNSFYTTSMSFSKDDFADFEDLSDEGNVGKIIVKVLIVIIFLAIIAGIVLFLNDFLKLGWF